MLTEQDRATIKGIIGRDEAVLFQFYTQHKKPLFQFIFKHLNNTHDAEEVLQDTFLAFAEALRDFRGQSSLKTFLFSIAKNKTVDKVRKKKLKQVLFSYIPAPIVESLAHVFLDDEIDKKQLIEKIDTVFGKLPHDYELVLRLKYTEGYKVDEIARKVKLSFKATESLIFRARKAFVIAYKTYDGYNISQIKK